MPKGTNSVAREADALELALKASGFGEDERVWNMAFDAWEVRGLKPALDLVRRLKAAPGLQSVELPAALAAALTQARAQLGDAQLTQILASAPQLGASLPDAVMNELSGKTAPGVGTITSDEKPPSRKKERASMAQLFDEGIKELNR